MKTTGKTLPTAAPNRRFAAFPSTPTIGRDVGDRFSRYCALDQNGACIAQGKIRTSAGALEARFGTAPPLRIALKTGTPSGWISRLLSGFGHEVLVANARDLRGIAWSNNKSDAVDAEKLARYARLDPLLLNPVQPRSAEMQQDLLVIRARDRLVAARTMLINAARGLAKSVGSRLPSCSSEALPQHSRAVLPAALLEALAPLLDQIEALSSQIRSCDRRIAALARDKHREAAALQTVPGVGPLTALSFVLTLGDKTRFGRSRDVGCYLGLRPRRAQSGERDPRLSITKAGNGFLRRLLVQSAHYTLSRLGTDSALRRWGLRLAAGGGRYAKRRAVVAVARKLSCCIACGYPNKLTSRFTAVPRRPPHRAPAPRAPERPRPLSTNSAFLATAPITRTN